MSAAGGPEQQRFDFTAGKRASKIAVVVLADRVRVEHPLLKEPLDVPLAMIGRAVHLEVLEDDDTVYRGRPRPIGLGPPTADANVVLVLDRPVTIPKFKMGAEQNLAISAKERRKGVTVDDLVLRVDDPAGLLVALQARGVATEASLPEAMRAVHGVAPPAEAAAIRAKAKRAQLKAMLLITAIALSMVVLFSFKIHENDEGSELVDHVVRQASVGFVLVGLAVLAALLVPLRERPRERPVGDVPSTKATMLRAFAPLVVLAGLMGLGVVARNAGLSTFFAFAPVLAAPAGLILWFVIREWRREREEAQADASAPGGGTAGEASDGAPEATPNLGYPPSSYRR